MAIIEFSPPPDGAHPVVKDPMRRRPSATRPGELVFVTDEHGVVRSVDGDVAGATGYPERSYLGRRFDDRVHPDDLAASAAALAASLERPGAVHRCSVRFRTAEGTWRRVRTLRVAADLPAGRPVVVMVVQSTDVPEALDLLVDGLDEGVPDLLALSYEGLWLTDVEGITTYVSEPVTTMLRCRSADLLGKPVWASIAEESRELVADAFLRVGAPEHLGRLEVPMVTPDGERRWAAVSPRAICDATGRPVATMAVLLDVTERHRSVSEATRHAHQQEAVAELSRRALVAPDLRTVVHDALDTLERELGGDGPLVWWLDAPEGSLLLGARSVEVAQGDPITQVEPDQWPAWALAVGPGAGGLHVVTGRDAMPAPLASLGCDHLLAVPVASGTEWVGAVGLALADAPESGAASGGFLASVGQILGAAGERQHIQHELRRLALHDALTGMANRSLFVDRLGQSLARRSPTSTAVLFVDLDGFKRVNDALGHGVGDRLLVEVARRLGSAVRAGDTVARLGRGRVRCHLRGGRPRGGPAIAGRIVAAVSHPVTVPGGDVLVTPSVGVAMAGSGDEADSLMRNADLAMYRAKAAGARRRPLRPGAAPPAVRHLAVAGELRRAIERGELVARYQPEVALAGTEIWTEALVRWQHPERGLLAPGEFMDVAEETGLVVPLGSGCWTRPAGTWCAGVTSGRGGAGQRGVNLSPRQLADPGLVDAVAGAIQRSGIDPALLWLEVTETA